MIEKTTARKSRKAPSAPQPAFDRETVLHDFETCCISREASILARKEVLTGKAKFGITGDGKEIPQVVLAKMFQHGDYRSGYYRDQTLMFALGISSVEQFFAQLYADQANDPFSAGRQMNSHYATPITDKTTGEWFRQTDQYNISSDISSTAGQMARSLGLAQASNLYRANPGLQRFDKFSRQGNEICFCTIGDASTSEGAFWETVNAAGVTQVPLAIFVWDDGYGISVPAKYQTTKGSISAALAGFQADEAGEGIDIYTCKAWDYPALMELFSTAISTMRETHRPALFHIEEVTQPQGHSTSGSHERYKSKERLQWERDFDCIVKMEQWMVANGLATPQETQAIRDRARKHVRECRDRAWKAYNDPTHQRWQSLKEIFAQLPGNHSTISALRKELNDMIQPLISEVMSVARRAAFLTAGEPSPARDQLSAWIREVEEGVAASYHTHLYSDTPHSALKVKVLPPEYAEAAPLRNGFEILNAFFDKAFERDPRLVAFGEDVGQIGDVNQGFAGLQKKYGVHRIFDTGIREWTIMGQAIGLAMRGLRPIAEIQYLDYLIYGLEPLMDDLATLRYRSGGIQCAPAIIRTRGHRLEGIWHAGSPMGMILNSLRGMYVLAPRNMTQAAGFYNTMLQSDDPAIIVECLNGYRQKERLPANIGEYTVPLGYPEVLQEGRDITIVTYGACVRVAQAGIELLTQAGISAELIDVQTLLPFDREHRIAESIKKTNRVLFLDEDVPGGATAYMMQEVLEKQQAYQYLDSPPATLTAHAHRPPYGSDGDYFSKPNPEDVFEAVYKILYEAEPRRFKGRL